MLAFVRFFLVASLHLFSIFFSDLVSSVARGSLARWAGRLIIHEHVFLREAMITFNVSTQYINTVSTGPDELKDIEANYLSVFATLNYR